ncbi:cation/H(+) antiporter 15-like [Miscanthus floridulus]|uniref:cation/H(+) antiporter 15-like n=1 Tax=Miscanthus floridulus TaxID=154761 RepID=UPI00345855DA
MRGRTLLITDVSSWFIRACTATVILIGDARSPAFTAKILASFVAFVLFAGFVARPVGRYITYKRNPPTGALLSEGSFSGGDHRRWSEASEKWCVLELFVALCMSGKLVGYVAAGLFFTMPFRDAIVLALMLNIRGIVEFARAKRRTLEHARLSADLRVLTCLYSEDHAAPLIDLLEASGSSRDSPMSLIVLHLTELVGHAASVLKPHRKSMRSSNSSGNPTLSDRIVNAFRYFEQQARGDPVCIRCSAPRQWRSPTSCLTKCIAKSCFRRTCQ